MNDEQLEKLIAELRAEGRDLRATIRMLFFGLMIITMVLLALLSRL